jgi:type I restriction enzyme S subunit
MINNLRPYPDYKDSGLPWLRTIPAHWEVRRNSRLFAQRNETGFGNLPILEVSLKTGVQVRDFEDSNRKQVMSDREKYKRAVKGDIAYNMMRLWQGAVGTTPVDGLVSPAYVVASPFPEVDSRYYAYLFRTDAYMNEVNKYSRGIVTDRNRLYWDEFKQMPSPFPPTDEQGSIAGFLDSHGQIVRRFIRNRRRLIEVLNEQKQAIINRATTRGIDPNVRLKSSGIHWLGDIPESWEMRRFKFIAHVTGGQIDPRHPPYRDYVLIAPNHIEGGTGRLLTQETALAQGASSVKYVVSCGQVIYSKIRPALRKATIAPGDCLCSADMYAISPRPSIMKPQFLLLLLLSDPATRYLVDSSMRVAMPKVNREALGNCWLWYPTLAEQDAIIEKLSQLLAPLDIGVNRVRRQIELVREYRSRLIADLVTGKLDVRHLTPQAIAHAPEDLESLDELDADEPQEDEDLEPVEEAINAD